MEKRGIENLINGFHIKPQSKDPDHQDLIKQLYEQIGQLTVERDWLKKNLHCLNLAIRKLDFGQNYIYEFLILFNK